MTNIPTFDLAHTLHALKHYLPAQAPLKDFVHHNTLHAFQELPFHEALHRASVIFGYKTYLPLANYRAMYAENRISNQLLEQIIIRNKGETALAEWKEKLLKYNFNEQTTARIGKLRAQWKSGQKINLDKAVHSLLFKIVGAYLDQGISIWNFPTSEMGFLASIRAMEKVAFTSLFQTKRARDLLMQKASVEDLLKIVVGNEALYERYLFDQQFAHPGWSGIVAFNEDNPEGLLDPRKIRLQGLITLELLLEIDALEQKMKGKIIPLGHCLQELPEELFAPTPKTELSEAYQLWQDAFEWTYYDQVLKGIRQAVELPDTHNGKTFQALFCIDDREGSLRNYIEQLDPLCKTFGTPGFFNIDVYFQPEHSKFHTKVCPAPITPKHLIKEIASTKKIRKDAHFTKHTHTLIGGWFISLTLGFWSIIQLFINIFRPGYSATMVSSFRHMDKHAKLTIENENLEHCDHGLQIGFTFEEMANRLEGLLRSIGLVEDFAPIIYAMGHGASSVNNTHYAGYDCGACSGRPGSVNARVIAHIGNHPNVREILKGRGILIPDTTRFLGGLHDTTRDEFEFYDEDILDTVQQALHDTNKKIFDKSLIYNAKERSRRFQLIDSHATSEKVHKKVKLRSVSLFEPRPELNHATNALCIVGRHELTAHLFLDRRAFMNTFDYRIDTTGKYLANILNAAVPVCGGINLEYYFSKVDNHRLGAGTKLPHNVMGLIGVANGMEGDLRTGLPMQMVEIHDSIRLMMIVEHRPEVILQVLQSNSETYEWVKNGWIHLTAVNPDNKAFYYFKDDQFVKYTPIGNNVETQENLTRAIESSEENLPVYIV